MNLEGPGLSQTGRPRTPPASVEVCCDEARHLADRIEELLALASVAGTEADRYGVRLAQALVGGLIDQLRALGRRAA